MNGEVADTGGLEAFPDEDQVFTPLYDSSEFADFEQEMDQLLAGLEKRWAHLAAPAAATPRLRRASLGSTHKKAM
jgi:hypothetical protein